MIENIHLVQVGGPYGDECCSYTFTTTKEHYTIQDLISDCRRNTGEWGYIEVTFAGVKYKAEYRHGRIMSNDIPEALFDTEIKGGRAHGGWSNMDYMVEVSTSAHGGKRNGAGRKRKGEELRIPITFSVDPSVMEKAQALRAAGFPLNIHIEALIEEKYSWYFNKPLGEKE